MRKVQRVMMVGISVTVLALAGCGLAPKPTRAPTCLPTSVPLNCVPPSEQPKD